MFVHYLPRGFWLAIAAFVAFQWLMIPVIAAAASHAVQVVWGALIIITFIYPLFVAGMLIYLKKVKHLTAEQLLVAGGCLLIPLLAYIPLIV